MSLLSRSELRIFMRPERVALLRSERRLTLRGPSSIVRARTSMRCDRAGDAQKAWRGALAALETALPAFVGRDVHANIVLSDTFMHYTLIPWFDNLSDAEDVALAQHRFREMCGEAADTLNICVSPGPPGVPSLAGAVDAELIAELTRLMERMKIRIRSIQPHFMVACNSSAASLAGRSAWIALPEPNSLCLGALREGNLVWIRKFRVGDAWQEDFPAILEREAYLADADAQLDEVMLWAPHLSDDDLPHGGRWRISRLSPDPACAREAQVDLAHADAETGA